MWHCASMQCNLRPPDTMLFILCFNRHAHAKFEVINLYGCCHTAVLLLIPYIML